MHRHYAPAPHQINSWRIEHEFGARPLYARGLAILSKTEWSVQSIDASIRKTWASHEALRTSLTLPHGLETPVLTVDDAGEPTILKETIPTGSTLDAVYRSLTSREDVVCNPYGCVCVFELPDQSVAVAIFLRAALVDRESLVRIFIELLEPADSSLDGVIQFSDVAGWLAEEAQDQIVELRDAAQSLIATPWRHLPSIDSGVLRVLGTQPAEVLLAVWIGVLARFRPGSDVVVEVIDSIRARIGSDAGIGSYDVPRCVQMTYDTSVQFAELLAQLRIRSISRDASTEKGFAEPVVGFHYSANDPLAMRVAGLRVQDVDVPLSRRKLSIELCARSDGIAFRLRFDETVFDEMYVETIARAFSSFMAAVLDRPHTSVVELDLSAANEPISILHSEVRKEINKTIVDYFNDTVARTPGAASIHYEGTTWSYAELKSASDAVALKLMSAGMNRGSVVAVLLPRSPQLLATALGIFKVGAVFLPLDTAAPPRNQDEVCANAGVSLIVADRQIAADRPDFRHDVIFADEVESQALATSAPRIPGAALEDLAYILYTSGSTGAPKGVEISHRSLANYLQFAARTYELENGRGALVQSPVTFDLTFTSLLAPLLVGQALIIAPEDADGGGAAAKIEFVRDQILLGNISLLKATPSYLRLLNELLSEHRLAGAVHTIVLGGEALPWSCVAPWRVGAPQTRIFNEYGPTETVVGSICAELDATYSEISVRAPIGSPIDNTSVVILDPRGCPLPVGAMGEIGIGGAGVGIGYRNRADATADRFITLDIGNGASARVYRTGDRGRLTSAGSVEFFGRLDEQMKVNGVRLEPEEILSVLALDSAVLQSAVVKFTDDRGADKLVAFVVGASGEVDIKRLASLLAAHLAPLHRPHFVLPIQSLPLSANGKINRSALIEIARVGAVSRSQSSPPRNAVEAQLAAIFGVVLGRTAIGIDDNFFDLGGDSIRSIAVVGRAAKAGLNFSIAQLFRQPTIRQLATIVQLEQAPASAAPAPFELLRPIDRSRLPSGLEDAYPTSVLQLAMIYHNEKDKGAAVYHDIFSYHITFAPQESILRAAAEILVARHEALRSTFSLSEFDEPLQLVHQRGVDVLAFEDITHLSPTQQESVIAKKILVEKQSAFDVARLPLLRLHFYRRDAATVQFTMSFHHSIIDGWSDVSLLTEFFNLYHLVLRGEAAPPRTTTRYRDFISLEKKALMSVESRDFWLRKLDDYPFPSAQSHQPERGNVAVVRVEVAEDAADKLRQICLRHSLPLKSVLLGIHLKIMSILEASQDIVTSMVASGRPETTDGDAVVGLFINSVPVRAQVGDSSWIQLARLALELEAEILPHRRFPFGEIKSLLGNRTLSRTLFYFTHYHIAGALKDIGINLLQLVPHEASSFALVANFWIDPFTERLNITVAADQAHYPQEQRERIAAYYARALASLLEDPHASHRQASILTHAEAAVVMPPLAESVLTLDEQIRRQAALLPGATALVEASVSINYAALDRRADLAAQRLKDLSVGKGDRVGVCAPRSIDLVIAAVGILRCGGIYVPMDPLHPADRLKNIVADAAPALVLAANTNVDVLSSICGCATDIAVITADAEERLFASASDAEASAYIFYTSGSTGAPKGVVVSHAAFASFAVAISPHLRSSDKKVWLAVTAPTFDISCLELIWTLAHGFTVILQGGPETFLAVATPNRKQAIDFSLFFFASKPDAAAYRLLVDAARKADALGFAAIWTPERHFHEFGAPFPNPALTSAALATVTQRIAIRAGSVVLPLHNPIRAAEDWAVVDNLSNGRAGMAVASGWHAEDFVLAPDAHADRRQVMFENIRLMRALWRGERIAAIGPEQSTHSIEIHPRPLRGDIPIWLSAASSPATFEAAGRIGAGVLTHLLSQDSDALAKNIARYRAAGDMRSHVTLMLHAYVGEDREHALHDALGPLNTYLSSSLDLASSTVNSDLVRSATPADVAAIVEQSQRRYLENASLIGSVEDCVAAAAKFRDMGVDEIACLIDFGVDAQAVLESVGRLDQVRQRLAQSTNSARSIFENIEVHGVTHLQCTPTLLRELASDPRASAAFSQLEVLLVGGEPLPDWLAERVRTLGVKRLLNMYGPTEATIWSSADEINSSVVTIGRPLSNTALFVLGPDLQQVAFDTAGEIYIGGGGLADGYWRRPDLTQDAFVVSPLVEHAGNVKLYRTGDLALRRSDGTLRFVGRIDRQVKIAGHRIELGEIELILRAHSEVHDCVVLLGPAGGIDAVVISTGGQAIANEVAEYAKTQLPAVMIPNRILVLDTMPKLSSGKLDRPKLSALLDGITASASEAVRPSTPVELRIATLWQETLGVAAESIHHDFFLAGGNSLRAMVMVAHLRREFARHLGVRTLFDLPTIAGLASLFSDTPQPLIHDAPIETWTSSEWPLSVWQERLWLIDRIAPGKAAYNDAVLVAVEGEFDTGRARDAISTIVMRHDALRATFSHGDGVPYAEYGAEALFEFDIVDLEVAGRVESLVVADALSHARTRASQPFDLAKGPLLRVTVFRMGDGRVQLLVVLHHIVGDGWSLALFLKEFSLLYDDLNGLPIAPPSYRALTLQERAANSAGRRAELSTYWLRQLADLPPPLELPLDFRRPSVETFAGKVEYLTVPATLVDSLMRLAQSNRATLFIAMAAVFSVALSRMTGRTDIVFGTDVANRAAFGAQDVIGLFVNQIVLRCDLAGAPSFAELLTRMREVAVAAYEHQDHPFNQLVEELAPERDLGRNPIYQVAFTLQEAAAFSADESRHWRMRPVSLDMDVSRLDLEINARRDAAEILIEARYNSALYRPEIIQRLLQGYVTLLSSAVNNPESSINSLSFFDADHRRQVLEDFNRTEAAYPQRQMLEMLNSRIAESPNDIAISDVNGELTYAQFGAAIECVAGGLEVFGVRRGEVVAVLSARTAALPTVLIALWRVGAVYLPLDPQQPEARSASYLTEAACNLIVHADTLATLAGGIAAEIPDGARSISIEALLHTRNRGRATVAAAASSDAAYILFTSGSTGKPKGAVVLHRGMMNHLFAKITDLQLGRVDVIAQTAPQTFDISIWQMLAALAVGGRLLLVSDDVAQTPTLLAELIESERVSIVELVPTLLDLLISASEGQSEMLRSLRWMISTGEALPVMLCRRWFAAFPAIPMVNAYGPTECSDDVAHHILRAAPAEDEVHIPIGTPIGNVRLHVVDEQLNLVPLGAAGELLVTGVCVGEGYINNPEASRRAFVKDPFDSTNPYLAYRTGDLVRRRGDGVLDYLGRIDTQVKLGGCRIELGEIESVLDSDPLVRRSVVTLVDNGLLGKRLCGYVTPDWSVVETLVEIDEREKRTLEWQSIYDYYYSQHDENSKVNSRFDTRGWTSSFTREPFPEAEMRVWLEQTIVKVRALNCRRILEIGCGSGMLLFALAADCERYAGLDLSEQIVLPLRDYLRSNAPEWSHVTVDVGAAHDLSAVGDEVFDLIIINSVAQYFPSARYLADALHSAAAKLAPHGSIFIGDVRTLELLHALHIDIQLNSMRPMASNLELRAAIQKGIDAENELLLSASYFSELSLRRLAGRPIGVMVWLKHGAPDNELFKYRYDTVLRLDWDTSEDTEIGGVNWRDGETMAQQLQRLARDTHLERVVIRGIPNQRLVRDRTIQERFAAQDPSAIIEELTANVIVNGGISPDNVAHEAAALGYKMQSRISADHGPFCFDVLLHRHDACWPANHDFPKVLANNPLRARGKQILADRLQARLKQRLPLHMTPQIIVVMNEFPMTGNGKIAMRLLPVPDITERRVSADEPRTATERILSEVWSSLLGVRNFGVRSNFFSLGGDSILGIQMVARAARLGLRFTPRQIFEHQTIAELAAVATTIETDGKDSSECTGGVPLSPIQLSLLEREISAPHHWNQAILVGTRLSLDVDRLQRAMQQLVHRHDSLRLRFERVNGQWRQHYSDLPTPVAIKVGPAAHPQWIEFADELNASLSLADGPVMACAIRPPTEVEPAALLLVAHHLVIDGLSWRILLDDLGELLLAAHDSRPARFASKTASYRTWVERQIVVAESQALREHLPFWLAQSRSDERKLFADGKAGETVTQRREEKIESRVFDASTIAPVLREDARQAGCNLEELLLTALAVTIEDILKRRDLVVLRESHGRDSFEDVDLSRTVGWFTTAYPLRIRLPRNSDMKGQLEAVMRQTRLAKRRELSYGVLRHLDPNAEVRRALAERPAPEIAFNYFGRLASEASANDFHMVEGYSGLVRDRADAGACPLEVNVLLQNERLVVHWTYNANILAPEILQRLATSFDGNLRSLAAFVAESESLSEPSPAELEVPSSELLSAAIEELGL